MKKSLLIIMLTTFILAGCSKSSTLEYSNEEFGVSFNVPNTHEIQELSGEVLIPGKLKTLYLWSKECLSDDACMGDGDAECFVSIYQSGSVIAQNANTDNFQQNKPIGKYVVEVQGKKDACQGVYDSLK